MSNIIELAKKIKALADGGIGGEKLNASKILKDYMQKHGLSESDIEENSILEYSFLVPKEKTFLFSQVVCAVLGNGEGYTYSYNKNHKSLIYLELTKSQYLEIDIKFNFYWNLYKKELNIFKHAFIQRNNIFSDKIEPAKISSLSKKEKEEALRIINMASTIEKAEIHKLIK